jgi:hypothetical protein
VPLVAHGGSLSEIPHGLRTLARKTLYLELENASLSEVLIAETYISVKRLNDTCHLASLRTTDSKVS